MKIKLLIKFVIIFLLLLLFIFDFIIYEEIPWFFCIILSFFLLIMLISILISEKNQKKKVDYYNSMSPIDCNDPEGDKDEVERIFIEDKDIIICINKCYNSYKYIIYVKRLDDDFYSLYKYYYWVPLNNGGFSFYDSKDKAINEAMNDIKTGNI